MRRFHDLEIQLYDVQEAPDYIIRKLDVSKRGHPGSSLCEENREIVHIQYTAWPDKSAPHDPGALLQVKQIGLVHSILSEGKFRPNSDKKNYT